MACPLGSIHGAASAQHVKARAGCVQVCSRLLCTAALARSYALITAVCAKPSEGCEKRQVKRGCLAGTGNEAVSASPGTSSRQKSREDLRCAYITEGMQEKAQHRQQALLTAPVVLPLLVLS